jgi:hypothetical protein
MEERKTDLAQCHEGLNFFRIYVRFLSMQEENKFTGHTRVIFGAEARKNLFQGLEIVAEAVSASAVEEGPG